MLITIYKVSGIFGWFGIPKGRVESCMGYVMRTVQEFACILLNRSRDIVWAKDLKKGYRRLANRASCGFDIRNKK